MIDIYENQPLLRHLLKVLSLTFFYLILKSLQLMLRKPSFKVLVVASADPDHDPMIKKAKAFLEKIGAGKQF